MSASMAQTPFPAHETGGSPTRHLGLLLCNDVKELDAVSASEVLIYWTLHHVNAPDHQEDQRQRTRQRLPLRHVAGS
jgi:hypothetical protein